MRFKLDWANLIVGSKFTIFSLFYKYKPLGGLYLEGRLTEGFLRYRFGGLIFGGAYFRNFTVFVILRIARNLVPRSHSVGRGRSGYEIK